MKNLFKTIIDTAEHFVYNGKWILAPLYMGLFIAIALYSYKFMNCLWELCLSISTLSEAELMLGILNLIDITMVGNLVVMVMLGGWHIFIRQFGPEERPQWLIHIDSSILKIKMGMSLIGVSSIHLLKSFINAGHVNWPDLSKQLSIHMIFVISTIAIAFVYRLQHPIEEHKHDSNHS